ncbi:unnamed protein product, partial [Choristocarpus tenellus]
DYTDCPLGCGDVVRVQDLEEHERSFCTSRYVECPTAGCGTMVQASLVKAHQRDHCWIGRKNILLAEKGRGAEEEVPCGLCSMLVRQRDLRRHNLEECKMRLVLCPNFNCKELVRANCLDKHQRIDCSLAKKQAMHLESAASKPKEISCLECNQIVDAGTIQRHTANECPNRTVACPNELLGCKAKLPAVSVPCHLREDCVVKLERSNLALRHEVRQKLSKCSGCGYMIRAQHMAHHHQEKCPNRRVRCKNWELGCKAVLCLSDMDKHLKVSNNLDPRACLAFNGGKAYISINEEDRKPPWTAEIWVWRPSLVEGTREKTRTALSAYWAFQQASSKLASAEEHLKKIEPLLQATESNYPHEIGDGPNSDRERLIDEITVVATQRDAAKLALVRSYRTMHVFVSAAIRGVKEIIALQRKYDLQKLALARPPWYFGDGSYTSSGYGGGVAYQYTKHGLAVTIEDAEGSNGEGNEDNDTNHQDKIPEGGPTTTKEDTIYDEPIATSSLGDNIGAPVLGSSVRRGSDAGVSLVLGGAEPLGSKKVEEGVQEDVSTPIPQGGDSTSDLLNDSKVGPEDELSEEASFWGKWVAMDGQYLVDCIIDLGEQELPLLKDKVEVSTGLAMEVQQSDSQDQSSTTLQGSRTDGGPVTGDFNKRRKKGRAAKALLKAKRKEKRAQQLGGVKLESQVAEETRFCGGTGTLFGSAKALIQLEMGQKDQVGVCIVGEAEHMFNYRCPRERWVHLSFVSSPQKELFLFENGKLVSRIKAAKSISLPMREIGGRECACQCLVQEVRYWGAVRTREELSNTMQTTLPQKAVKDNLIGYWTLEEGSRRHTSDVTQQRFRSPLVGHNLEWVKPELIPTLDVGQPPTPSWRDKNTCKV